MNEKLNKQSSIIANYLRGCLNFSHTFISDILELSLNTWKANQIETLFWMTPIPGLSYVFKLNYDLNCVFQSTSSALFFTTIQVPTIVFRFLCTEPDTKSYQCYGDL